MQRLEGNVAVVTGASRGIGAGIAGAFAAEGALVAVCYNEGVKGADTVVSEIVESGGRAMAVRLPVEDRAAIKEALGEVTSKLGQIDILVNNAGINIPNDFDKISDSDWDRVLGVNLTGPFRVTQVALPYLADNSSIINISSVSGQYGGPRTTHYCVSKAGLIALTQNLAIFCAKRKIRVNAISPGLIASDMAGAATGLGIEEKILLKKMGEYKDVADAAVFLASGESSYITGHTLNVNGGLYIG